MLLAIDIGNTNVVIGCIRNDEILFRGRIVTDHTWTSDRYGAELLRVLEEFRVDRKDLAGCVISSVVPPVLNAVRSAVIETLGTAPLVVGPETKTGLDVRVDVPAQVGRDRIVAAAAAAAAYPAPLIVMDLGTATTIDVVEPGNLYMGGVIVPGVKTALDALISRAAQLTGVSLEKPGNVIGKNTVDGIRSGMIYGTAAMIDGVVARMEEELGHQATLVATGGLAPLITPCCRRHIILDPDLLLKGLNILYKMNKTI